MMHKISSLNLNKLISNIDINTSNLLLFLFTALALNSQAQDYQTVCADRSALFKNPTNQIIGLRIDSVKIESDTILYPFATIQDVSAEGCFSPYKASWIGQKVIIKPNGNNLFFNRECDTITLKTRAQLHESWITFHRADTFIVEATVQNISSGEFFGLNDTVKTIHFRVSDQNGNTIEHDLNNLKVKISKNHGFVETLNFYLFPDFTVRITGDRLEKHTLVGLTNPDVGIQNLKWFDVFDFNAGDELHIIENRTGNPPFSPFMEFEKKTIFNYLERTDYSDSIVYRCSRKQSIEKVYSDSSSLEINSDTVKQVIHSNPGFDKFPGEPVIDSDLMYSYYMKNEQLLKKIDQLETQQFVFNNGCYRLVVGDACLREMEYFQGLSGPYYSCTGYVGDSEERKLVYYKKGETEWGEKLIITGVSDFRKDNNIQVYPNPANDAVTFQLNNANETTYIQLFNATGSLTKSIQFNSSSHQLDLTGFKNGIYFYRIGFEGSVYTGKLILE